jgi:hypothetical protein
LGYALLIFVILLAAALAYSYYKQGRKDSNLPGPNQVTPVVPPLPAGTKS